MLLMILVGCVVCGAAVASEESGAGQAGATGAAGVQGVTVAPGQARAVGAGNASATESAAGGVGGITVGSTSGNVVVPGGAASMSAPSASAAEVTGGAARESVVGRGVRVETAPSGVRVEMAPSGAGEGVSATGLKRAEGVGRAAASAAGLAPGKMEASGGSGEGRVVNRAGRSLGVHGVHEERVRGEALSEISNVGIDEQVARMSPDRAWTVNQADVLAVRERTEEVRASNTVASRVAHNSADEIRARREVLAMSAPIGAEESVARGEAHEEAMGTKAGEEVSSASTRVVATSEVTLVHVTARNVTDEVVERPLVEIVLPKGMRYEALASGPPNTAVRVERTEAGEKVEMVLPFALFQREAIEIAVETSPAPEVGVSGVRARVRPLEEGLRVVPRGTGERMAPMGSEGAAASEHLHPRP